MNILVTGGCGFIGSNFIRQRLAEPNSPLCLLVNLDALTYAGNPANLADLAGDPRYVFEHGDIGDEDSVARLLETHNIDAILNFAAESHVDRSIDSPEPFVETNVLGTLRLLNATRRYWNGLSAARKAAFRFLHVSTDEVYGTLAPEEAPWNEDCPYQPNSPYAASKAGSDHLVRAFQHTYKLPTLTTNCSNNYGPLPFPRETDSVDHSQRPRREAPARLWRRPANSRLVVAQDHATAIWLVLQRGREGETYNVGGLNERPNIEIVRTICELLDRKHPRADGRSYVEQIEHVADRPGHDRRYAIDSTKIRRELGWRPRETFETGIEKTVDWYLANRAWADAITTGTYARHRLGCATI